MDKPLWQKDGVDIDDHVMRFLAGDDVILDQALFLFDIRATKAHVECLVSAKILSSDECEAVVSALEELAADFSAGRFRLDERYEDGHSAIEAELSNRLGDIGRKIHTGRSRNDQVLVASRLYLVQALTELQQICSVIAGLALEKASQTTLVPMPGYTHMQPAVVSSLGLWYASIAEAFIDNALLAQQTRSWLNANPLGTAAGYGVNLELDRDGVSQKLGFDRLQLNPLYTQNSRGKFELQALSAMSATLLDVRRLAWDLSLFTSREFSFVTLPARFTTGSSIMPNKRNPDVVELLRAEFARTQGAMSEIQSLLSLPAGYHRDLQATKGPVIRAISHGMAALALLPDLLGNLSWDESRLLSAIEDDMYATDRAIEMARENIPFRDAYRIAADSAEQPGQRDPVTSLRDKISPGAPGNLQLSRLAERLRQVAEAV